MMDFVEAAMEQRSEYVRKLEEAGYTVTGAGMSMPDLEWEIFITNPVDIRKQITIVGPAGAELWLKGVGNA